MDKLTDILSSFFVNTSKKNENQKQTEAKETGTKEAKETEVTEVKETETKEAKETETKEAKETEAKEVKETEVKEAKETKVEKVGGKSKNKSKVLEHSVVSEIFSEIQEVLNKKKKFSTGTNNITTTSPSLDDSKESILSSLSYSCSSSLTGKESKILLKKYILRPSGFYKSNTLIVNDDIKDSIELLSDLLYKLGLMTDVNVIYDNNIHVITSVENKKIFTKMLLDNPYLYFTNFNVKQQLSRKRINDLDKLEKRTIYIIDSKTLTKPLKQKDLQTLTSKNVHVIIIAGEDFNLDKTYNLMGKNRLLIHKLNKSKNMQKHFYKTTIKKICLSKNISFDDYYNIINDENIDIKYIILKNDEIRYN